MRERIDVPDQSNHVILESVQPEISEQVAETEIVFSKELAAQVHAELYNAQDLLTTVVHNLHIRHEDRFTDLIKPEHIEPLGDAVLKIGNSINTAEDLEEVTGHLKTIRDIMNSLVDPETIDVAHDSHASFLYLSQKFPLIAEDMKKVAQEARTVGFPEAKKLGVVALEISDILLKKKIWMTTRVQALGVADGVL